MQKKFFLPYFFEGFNLATNNLTLFLLSFLIPLVGYLRVLFPQKELSLVISLITFVGVFFSVGFQFSLPYFLNERREEKKLSWNLLYSTTVKNTKRVILPILFLGVLLIICFFISLAFFFITKQPAFTITKAFSTAFSKWNPFFFLVNFSISLFCFSPALFSLENHDFFASLWKSLKLSLHHMFFILCVSVVTFLAYTLTTLIPTNLPFDWVFGLLISSFVSFVLSATTLLYYLDRIKKVNS